MTSRMRASRAVASRERTRWRLQQIGEGVDLGGQFAEGVAGACSAGAKGVVAFAQGGDDVGERLQGADQALDHARRR